MAERFGRPPADPNSPAAVPVVRHTEIEDEETEPTPTPATTRGGSNTPVVRSSPTAGSERIDLQVQKHQEELLALRRQQEQIERQKRELEELSRRQEQLEQGRTEMVEKLTRAAVIVERQCAETRQRVEQLQSTGDTFGSHLNALEAINPKAWASADLQRELNRALAMVDHARTEYNQQKGRLATEAENGEADPSAKGCRYDDLFGSEPDHSFLYFLKAGFAFTLPLVIVLLIVAFLLCWKLVNGSV